MQPNSTLKILKGVDIDKDYKHTRRFVNTAQQYNYFTNTFGGSLDTGVIVKFSLTDLSYQRMNSNTIRVGILSDNLYDCNYIMFRNRANNGQTYSDKWFYAFIDSVEYINDHCSEIKYTIDVIQSYMFDIKVGECFVEREHSSTDRVGDNTVSEDFAFNEYYKASTLYSLLDDNEEYFAGFVSKKAFSSLLDHSSSPSTTSHTFCVPKPVWHETNGTINYGLVSNIPSALYFYLGFTIEKNSEYDQNYYMQELGIPADGTGKGASITEFIELLSKGNLYTFAQGDDGTTTQIPVTYEDIVDIYIYPKKYALKTKVNSAIASGYGTGFTREDISDINIKMPKQFTSKNPNELGLNFSNVKNKKLLTSPFVNFAYTDFNGNECEFNFDYFISSQRDENGLKIPSFRIVTNKIAGFSVNIMMPFYGGDSPNQYEKQIDTYYSMTPFYSGNSLASFLQQHSNSLNFGVLSSILSSVAGIGTSLITRSINTGISATIGGATSVGDAVAKINDIKNTPSSSNYSQKLPFFLLNQHLIGGYFYSKTVSSESAKIVDDFFSMFGYATKRVKTPNIFKYWDEQYDAENPDNNHIRRYWNYIKTNGAIIHPKLGLENGLSSTIEQKISNIIDNGITYWNLEFNDNNTIVEIGDYSKNNNASIR